MALRLIEATQLRLRGPRVDVWNTISAWVWATYLFSIAAVVGWWWIP